MQARTPAIKCMKRNTQNQKSETPELTKEPAKTVGTLFSTERETQNLTVEEVAKILCLRPSVIRALEQDDLSSFSHASYARLTLLGYARLLQIPASNIQQWLPEAGNLCSNEHRYLDHYAHPAEQTQEFSDMRKSAINPFAALFKIALAILLLLILAYGYLFYINLGRIKTVITNPAPITKPTAPNETSNSTSADMPNVTPPKNEQDTQLLEKPAADIAKEAIQPTLPQ